MRIIITGSDLGRLSAARAAASQAGERKLSILFAGNVHAYFIFQHNRATVVAAPSKHLSFSAHRLRTTRQARGKHKVLPRCANEMRRLPSSRRESDRPDHESATQRNRKSSPARMLEKGLRDRLLLSGRSTWYRTRSHAGSARIRAKT